MRRLERQCPYVLLVVCLDEDSWCCLCQVWVRKQLGSPERRWEGDEMGDQGGLVTGRGIWIAERRALNWIQ